MTTQQVKYNHIEAARLSSCFLNEIYSEVKSSLKKMRKSKILLIKSLTYEQDYAFCHIASDLNYDWMWSWQISLFKICKCKEAKDIHSILLSPDDVLRVLFDLLEFKCVRYGFDFIPFLLIIQKVIENNDLFSEAKKLWAKIRKEFSEDPNDEKFDYYQYFGDLEYNDLPPLKPVSFLSHSESNFIKNKISSLFNVLK